MLHRSVGPTHFVRRLRMLLGALLISGVLPPHTAPLQADDSPPAHDVVPLLREYCAGCHNDSDPAAGLSLQSGAGLLRGSENGAVVDREQPDASRLWQVLTADDDTRMPPEGEAQPTDSERRQLLDWLRAGAPLNTTASAMLDVPNIEVTVEQPQSPVAALARLGSNRIVSGRFGRLAVHATDDLTVVRQFDSGDRKITEIQVTPDGSELLLATGIPGLIGEAIAIASETGSELRRYGGHSDLLYTARCSPDGTRIATAGYDRAILIHNRTNGEVVRRLKGHNGAVFDIAFSPDGTLLASASADATVKVWNLQTGERMDTLSQPLAEQYAVVFSNDGQFLYAAGADNRIRKYRIVSRNTPRINPLEIVRFAHDSPIVTLQLSPDGRFLVSASEDQSLKIWDAAAVRQVHRIDLDQDWITSVTCSADSDAVFVGTSRGDVRRYPLPGGLRDRDRMESADAPERSLAAAAPPTAAAEPAAVEEQEPNDTVSEALTVPIPAVVRGIISPAADSDGREDEDVDCFAVDMAAGQQLCLDVRAAGEASPLDSRVEVLDENGNPVLRVRLQAVRDSWFTFRGKDSTTSDDFRLFNWQEMELKEYLFADGEVVRLWMYPRGPDSGFKVDPGFGQRHTFFGTTPVAHALQAPAFIVRPLAPDAEIVANGLPVFPIYYANDDDPLREWGSDSRLMFTAPQAGRYAIRVQDARGFGSPQHAYTLTVRTPKPDFEVRLDRASATVFAGTGRELTFTARRIDGYRGPIEIRPKQLPDGFTLSEPLVIQADQYQAFATLVAGPDARMPDAEPVGPLQFVAQAHIGGQSVEHAAGSLSELKIADQPPKIQVRVLAQEPPPGHTMPHTPELTIHPGETLRCWVQVDRNNHEGDVSFGKEDSGRNLPHGIFVDNIGLNGLLIPPGLSVREVFLTAADWVPETSRPFHLTAQIDGGVTSLPVMLHVRRPTAQTPTAAGGR